jgi:hypothetical protein
VNAISGVLCYLGVNPRMTMEKVCEGLILIDLTLMFDLQREWYNGVARVLRLVIKTMLFLILFRLFRGLAIFS